MYALKPTATLARRTVLSGIMLAGLIAFGGGCAEKNIAKESSPAPLQRSVPQNPPPTPPPGIPAPTPVDTK